jgi:hypothetical protein
MYVCCLVPLHVYASVTNIFFISYSVESLPAKQRLHHSQEQVHSLLSLNYSLALLATLLLETQQSVPLVLSGYDDLHWIYWVNIFMSRVVSGLRY